MNTPILEQQDFYLDHFVRMMHKMYLTVGKVTPMFLNICFGAAIMI